MNKSKLRIFTNSIVITLLLTTTGLVFGGWILKDWQDTVTKKFAGRKWVHPSKIYSDSYLLYVGINIRPEDLREKLRRLGYLETRATPNAKGEYFYQANQGSLEIYLHDFAYPTEPFKGIPVKISLQSAAIARIENKSNGQELFSSSLSPSWLPGCMSVPGRSAGWSSSLKSRR